MLSCSLDFPLIAPGFDLAVKLMEIGNYGLVSFLFYSLITRDTGRYISLLSSTSKVSVVELVHHPPTSASVFKL